MSETKQPPKRCGNCRRIRGAGREWHCAIEGPEATVAPSYPAEYCSAWIGKEKTP